MWCCLPSGDFLVEHSSHRSRHRCAFQQLCHSFLSARFWLFTLSFFFFFFFILVDWGHRHGLRLNWFHHYHINSPIVGRLVLTEIDIDKVLFNVWWNLLNSNQYRTFFTIAFCLFAIKWYDIVTTLRPSFPLWASLMFGIVTNTNTNRLGHLFPSNKYLYMQTIINTKVKAKKKHIAAAAAACKIALAKFKQKFGSKDTEK